MIDFTARQFHVLPLDAARKLAADFGIAPNTPVSAGVALPAIQQKESPLLKNRQKQFAPVHPSDEWDHCFVSASHALPQVSCLIDCLYDADDVVRKGTTGSLLGDGTLRSIERWNDTHRKEAYAHSETLAA
ncbi:MAG: hypothetical protein ACI4O7_04045 [Aristaeellaceae bacterium]